LIIVLGLLVFSFFDLDISLGISRKVSVGITVALVFWLTYLEYRIGGIKNEKK
jgi:hypothetical protein